MRSSPTFKLNTLQLQIYTKQSQWEKPTEPVYGDSGAPPSHPPPSYASHPNPSSLGPEKFVSGTGESDEAYARRLQAEENARAGPGHYDNNRGASDDYYRQSQGTGVVPGPAPPLGGGVYNQSMPVNESKSKGLLGKLMGGGHSQPHPQAQYAPQQGYYQQGGCKFLAFLFRYDFAPAFRLCWYLLHDLGYTIALS